MINQKSMRNVAAVIVSFFLCQTFAHSQTDNNAYAVDRDTELEAFIDGMVTANREQHNMAGVALSVVQGDKLVVLKGYGYADIGKKERVDPARHMFRVGSITKTFTFTLLMQLVEDGRIALDADVNDYLTKFKIPPAFGKPIRIRDLLTHRPGFEESYRDLFVDAPEKFMSLEQWLTDNMPARVFQPGEKTSYSNYGAALAGYIVQNVSGTLYEEYLEEKILIPLSMTLTTAKQVLPPDSKQSMPQEQLDNIASVYGANPGYLNPEIFELIVGAPAGSISSTALDMARYMSAHLGDGSLDGVQILQPETARRMRARPYPGRPAADYAHGFRTVDMEGHDTFEHGGATGTSYSSMVMVPDLGIGVFVTTNGADYGLAPQVMARQLARKIIGDRSPDQNIKSEPDYIAFSAEDAAPFIGRYMTTRRVYNGRIKILSAFSGADTVALSPNNGLIIGGAAPDEYFPIGDLAFRSPKTGEIIAFVLGEDGRAVRYTVGYGHTTMDRMPSDTNPQSLFTAIALAVILSLTQFAAAWRRRSEPKPAEIWAVRLYRLQLFSVTSMTLFLLTMLFFVAELSAYGRGVIFAWPMTSVSLLIAFVILHLFFTIALLAGLWPSLTKSRFPVWRKIHYAVLTAVFANLMLQLHNWNMVGFNYW